MLLYIKKTKDAFGEVFAVDPSLPSQVAAVKKKFGVVPNFEAVETALDNFAKAASTDPGYCQQTVGNIQHSLHEMIADIKTQTGELLKAKFKHGSDPSTHLTTMVKVFFAYAIVKRIENFLLNLLEKYNELKIDGLAHAMVRQVAILVNPKDELLHVNESLLTAPERLLAKSLTPSALFAELDERASFTHSISGCGASPDDIKNMVRGVPVAVCVHLKEHGDALDSGVQRHIHNVELLNETIAAKELAKAEKAREKDIKPDALQAFKKEVDDSIAQMREMIKQSNVKKQELIEGRDEFRKVIAVLENLQVTDIVTFAGSAITHTNERKMMEFLDKGVPIALSVLFFKYEWDLVRNGGKSEIWTSDKLGEVIGDVMKASFDGVYLPATRKQLLTTWQTRARANGDLFVELPKIVDSKFPSPQRAALKRKLTTIYTNHFKNVGFGILAATQKAVRITTGGHIMSVVGYGYKNASMYVIAKNSWGKDWACGGYFRVDTHCHSYQIRGNKDGINKYNINFDCIHLTVPDDNPYGIIDGTPGRTFSEKGLTETADRFSIVKGFKGTENLALEKAIALSLDKPFTNGQLGLPGGSTSHLGEIGLDVDEDTPVKDLHDALGLKLGFRNKCMLSIAGKKIHEDQGQTLKDFGYLSGGCLKLENCRNLYLNPELGVEYVLPMAHSDFDAPGTGKVFDEVAEVEMQLDKLVQMLSWKEHHVGERFDTRMEYRIELPKAGCNAPEVVTSEYLLFDTNMFGVYGCVHYSDIGSFFLVSKDQISGMKNIPSEKRFKVSNVWEMGA